MSPRFSHFLTMTLAGTHRYTYDSDADGHNERKRETIVKSLLEN